MLLTSIVSASNHIKCCRCTIKYVWLKLLLFNLHPNEYSPEFHYYPFAVNLDRCAGTCNTNDVPNETEDLNLRVSTMTTGINKLRTLTKLISGKYECKFDDRKRNLNQNCVDQ